MKAKWAALFWIAALTSQGCGSAAAQGRFPIEPAQVVLALSKYGAEVSPRQISMPSGLIAAVPNPALEILAVDLSSGMPASTAQSPRRFWIKLSCRERYTCLPFYVLVAMQGRAGEMRFADEQAAETLEKLGAEQRADITIRAGTHAILILDRGPARVEISVVSLENGVAGKRIRVATPDYKQFYEAEVVSANVLKGTF